MLAAPIDDRTAVPSSQRLVAIVGTRYPDFSIEQEALGDLDVALVSGDGADAEDLVATAAGAEVVLAGSRPRFSAEVLRRLSCRAIVRYGVGTDSIDLAAARELGITVARVSDYGTEAVALHAVAMALTLLRRLPEADAAVRRGSWGVAGLRPLHLPSALTAGVIGYGRIGRQAATYFRGLGFTVCATDEYADVGDAAGVQQVSLDDLLRRSDVVSLHVPGRAGGAALLGAPQLSLCKAGSVLVNTARGSLVDTPALVGALQQGRPAWAALDVHDPEPPDLLPFEPVADRVLLTPHMAWYTEESEADMRRKAAAEATRVLRGEPLRDPVEDPEAP